MTQTADTGALPPGPDPYALAVALDLVTRYRLRLTHPDDARLRTLEHPYELGAAAWTGRRSAFVGFYQPPADPDEAVRDLTARVEAAERWGNERLALQPAERCDILVVALRPVGRVPLPPASGSVRVGAVAVDPETGTVQPLLPLAPGLPTAAELRSHARALRQGRPWPTLAAVDLAERQTVAGGYAQPARRALGSTPVATYGLIAVLVGIYLLERAYIGHLRGGQPVTLLDFGALVNTSDLGLAPGVTRGASPTDWWRYVSSAFLHDESSLYHILGNGIALLFLGRLVEQLYGRLVLVGAFLLTAVGGGLLWVAAEHTGVTGPGLSIGASGGITGLMGLLVMLGRRQGRDVPAGIAATIRQYAISYAALSLLFGFIIPNVNNYAHVGGFLSGALLGLVLPPTRAVGGRDLRPAERVFLAAVLAASAAALVVAGMHLGDALRLPAGGDTLPPFS